MKLGLFCAYDTVSKTTVCCMSSATGGSCVRENYLALRRIVPDVENDLRLYQIADFDNEKMIITPLPSPVLVPWDSYKFPEAVLNPPKEAPRQVNDKSRLK